MEDLLRHVRRFAGRYDLLPSHGVVVVGVSGGPDSLCLLHVLRRLAAEYDYAYDYGYDNGYGYTLHVAHLDHGMRGEASAADARFVAETAAAWGLPCALGRADVATLAQASGLSLEEAGREARYRFLMDTARAVGASTVAVGHNADDQAETVLMHFLRGSAAAGLRGMLPRAEIGKLVDWETGGWQAAHQSTNLPTTNLPIYPVPALVRPLLTIPRATIEAYCAEHGLQPRRDASNDDTSLRRNRVRHELLPLLEQYNPAIRDTLGRTAAVMAGDHETIEAAVDAAWARVALALNPGVFQYEGNNLDLHEWRSLSLGLQRATLRRAISQVRGPQGSLRDVAWEHVETAVWLAREGATGKRATLPGGLALEIGYDTLRVGPDRQPAGSSGAAAWPQLPGPVALAVPGITELPGGWRVLVNCVARDGLSADSLERIERITPAGGIRSIRSQNPLMALLDADTIGPELILRPRLPGDRFQPYGLGGHSVKLNEFMIDSKIPRAARSGWPLLVGARGIAWVCGLRVDERAAVRPETRRVCLIDIIRTDSACCGT